MLPPRLVQPEDDGSDSTQLLDVGRPFSNFQHVDQVYQGATSIRRLFSQARVQEARTAIVESIQPTDLVEDENEEIRVLFADYTMTALQRISFWRCDCGIIAEDGHGPDDLIGLAILKCDRCTIEGRQVEAWHVFESVFRKSPYEHNYVPGERLFNVQVQSKALTIPGWLYCQQNGLNKACAQVGLRSLLEGHRIDVLPYSRINSLARAVRPFRPSDGLDTDQIRRVLDELGIKYTDDFYEIEQSWCGLFRRRAQSFLKRYLSVAVPAAENLQIQFQQYLYAGIEAGEGALLAFDLQGPGAEGRHGIPVFGHTFNADTWVSYAENDYFHVGEETRYIPSENWLSSFIVHDDNFGSNLCIPRHYVTSRQVRYVLSIHRDGFEVCGVQAEVIAIDYLETLLPSVEPLALGNYWLRQLVETFHEKKIVLRAIPLDSDEFEAHLGEMRDWEGGGEDEVVQGSIRQLLPAKLWMIEISIPELFPSNKRKVGCLVLDGEAALGTELNFESFVFARLPGFYFFFEASDADGVASFTQQQSSLQSHVRVYGH